MQITIDTATDEFEDAVRALYSAYGQSYDDENLEEVDWEEEPPAEAPANAQVLPGGWTYKRLKRWTDYLQPGASEIVRYVAANAPEIDFDDVAIHYAKYLGVKGPVSGRVVGGAMSSGGHALRQVGKGVKSQPIDRDWARRRYVIDERIAGILSELLGPPHK